MSFSRFGKIYLLSDESPLGHALIQVISLTDVQALFRCVRSRGHNRLKFTPLQYSGAEWDRLTPFRTTLDTDEANLMFEEWAQMHVPKNSEIVDFNDLNVLDGFRTLAGIVCVKTGNRAYIPIGSTERLVSFKGMQVHPVQISLKVHDA